MGEIILALFSLVGFGLAIVANERKKTGYQDAQDAQDAPQVDNGPQEYQEQQSKPGNMAAFLMMVRHAEGTADANGYRRIFGGQLFDSFADHPRIAKLSKYGWTSAAGAYQFMAVSPIPTGGTTKVNTWDSLKSRLSLPDFSPESQDAAAIQLVKDCGAYQDVLAGRITTAIAKCGKVWASLPGAGYGQPEQSQGWLIGKFRQAGGVTYETV